MRFMPVKGKFATFKHKKMFVLFQDSENTNIHFFF